MPIPTLVAALSEQAAKLWHVSNLYRSPNSSALAERLVAATFADTVFFTNSGTEAIELRDQDGAQVLVRPRASPSGSRSSPSRAPSTAARTGAIAAAGSEKMVKGFGPLMPGFDQLPWGDHRRGCAPRSARRPRRC